MRAWIEPDDDEVPVFAVERMGEDEKINMASYRPHAPLKWHMEIDEVPE